MDATDRIHRGTYTVRSQIRSGRRPRIGYLVRSTGRECYVASGHLEARSYRGAWYGMSQLWSETIRWRWKDRSVRFGDDTLRLFEVLDVDRRRAREEV